jgi:hypothetical protein
MRLETSHSVQSKTQETGGKSEKSDQWAASKNDQLVLKIDSKGAMKHFFNPIHM